LMNMQTKLDFIKMAMENIAQNRSISLSFSFLRKLIKTFLLEAT
jgi:hypothetical protein